MPIGVSAKAGLAFFAGVVLALGGAFTYFKIAEPQNKAVVQPTVASESNKPVSPVASPSDGPAVAPSDQPAPAVDAAPVVVEPSKPIKPKSVAIKPAIKPKVTSRPVSLAVASPPQQYQQPQAPTPSSAAPTDLPVAPPAPPPTATTPDPMPAQPTPVQPAQPHTVTIPAGTNLSIRLNEKLSTDHNYAGDTFRASLDGPIVVDGFIIADKGAKVLGRIVKADKAGKLDGASELSLTLTEVSTTDGQKMHVETNQSLRKGPSNTTQSVEKMGGGAALGAIIGAIAGGGKGAAIGAGAGGAAGTGAVLFGHGKPVVMDAETRLSFQLTSPTTLTEKLN